MPAARRFVAEARRGAGDGRRTAARRTRILCRTREGQSKRPPTERHVRASCGVVTMIGAKHRALLALAAAILTVLVGACAGEGGGAPEGVADTGPQHVHGLGVNPADGSLYLATHTGLFRMRRGANAGGRVGDGAQDTMGFAVAGPDRFLGSGHPDPRDDLPPLLGLIESSDGGRTWKSVSLQGEADFHALRAVGPRVVGYDASNARLMVSKDSGRTWTQSRPPAGVIDLAVDPRRPDRIVAATGTGLMTTSDDGASWRRGTGDAGILAWPTSDALYTFADGGDVSVSRDGGVSWERTGDLGGEPAAATADARDSLIVALHDGRIVSSGDGGHTWSEGPWSAGGD